MSQSVEREDNEIGLSLEEAAQRLDKLRKQLTNCKSLTRTVQKNLESQVKKVEDELDSAKRAIKRVEIETRELETESRAMVRQSLKNRVSKLRELKSECKLMLNEVRNIPINDSKQEENESLLGTALDLADNLNHRVEWERDGHHNEDDLMDYARKLQKSDLATLDRVIINVDHTKQIAADTAQQLADQTAQIERVDHTLSQIDSELIRAKRTLIILARRMLTDKILWFFIACIALALLTIILLETGLLK